MKWRVWCGVSSWVSQYSKKRCVIEHLFGEDQRILWTHDFQYIRWSNKIQTNDLKCANDPSLACIGVHAPIQEQGTANETRVVPPYLPVVGECCVPSDESLLMNPQNCSTRHQVNVHWQGRDPPRRCFASLAQCYTRCITHSCCKHWSSTKTRSKLTYFTCAAPTPGQEVRAA